MKIEDLIGKRFYTLAQRNDVYKIEKINEFGKVVLSFNGGSPFEYHLPDFCLNAIKNGSWILIEEQYKNPFYLDEYIHNNDTEKRVEAENQNTRSIRELSKSAWDLLNNPNFFTKEEYFDIEIQSTMQKIQQLLLVKGKEYRRNNNPYHNFEVAARKKGTTPERALDGFLLKHLVSYDDMLNDIEHGVLPKIEVVEEKMNDIISYFLIQKAQILNRINNGKS